MAAAPPRYGAALMPFLQTAAAVTNILGGVGGIFGKKPTPRTNMISQARGAREAAEKYGFNPLTMLQYGQPGGLAGGGAPPLASVEFLTNGLNNLSAELNGDNERQRQADQLNLDLAKLKLEQARAGVAIVPTSAADGIGGGSPLGSRAVTVTQSNGRTGNGRLSLGSGANVGGGSNRAGGSLSFGDVGGLRPLTETDIVDPRRKVENDPIKTGAGFMVVDNPYLPFKVYVPTLDGDEPMDIWQGLAAAPFIVGSGALAAGQALGRYQDRKRGVGPKMTIDGETYQLETLAPYVDPDMPLSPNSSGFTSVPGVPAWLN